MVLLEAKLLTGLELTVIICSAAVSAGDRARSPDKAMVFLVAMLQTGLVPNADIVARKKAKLPTNSFAPCGNAADRPGAKCDHLQRIR